jgi:cytochrome c-type biogenesis protein CcmH
MRFPVVLALMLAVAPALAVKPGEQLKDPAQEARARALSSELRCLVCQNQSIDDSDASLAQDLRVLVRERISAGDSDAQIMAFVVARYGDFVLLKPAINPQTYALWAMPGVALVLGGWAVMRLFRRRKVAVSASVALSSEEKAALDSVLGKKD